MFASVEGLAEWYGVSVDDLKARDPQVEQHLKGTETRLLAYIAPSYPQCEAQAKALEQADYYQYDKENGPNAQTNAQIPSGATSFTIGHFSMSFAERSKLESAYFPAGISPDARGQLLVAGLLYRGVCGA